MERNEIKFGKEKRLQKVEAGMTLSEMRERKRELGYSYEQIADKSGVPLSTVQKVFSGATQSPRYETLYAIEKVLVDFPPSVVREAVSEYGKNLVKQQGEYTVEDYYNWPEDERIELIDGVIYYMETPLIVHQDIVSEIGFVLKSFIKKNKGRCKVYDMPVDVQLDCDNKTMVQPDIQIVCDRDKFTERVVFGAPDFVLEVLSPSTRKKDMTIKLNKYVNAGVREYWIVDPKKETVLVYEMNPDEEGDMQVSFYTFESQVPVRIFDNECIVDFKEIKEYMEG